MLKIAVHWIYMVDHHVNLPWITIVDQRIQSSRSRGQWIKSTGREKLSGHSPMALDQVEGGWKEGGVDKLDRRARPPGADRF